MGLAGQTTLIHTVESREPCNLSSSIQYSIVSSLEAQHLFKVCPAKVREVVALSGKGQHSVGSQPNGSVHTRCEMDAQERKPRIRHLCEVVKTADNHTAWVILLENGDFPTIL